jgi:hypothetical protein
MNKEEEIPDFLARLWEGFGQPHPLSSYLQDAMDSDTSEPDTPYPPARTQRASQQHLQVNH